MTNVVKCVIFIGNFKSYLDRGGPPSKKIIFFLRGGSLKNFFNEVIARRIANSRRVDQWLRSDLMVRRYKAYVPGFTEGSRWPLVFALVSKARGYHDHSWLSILLWARQDVRIYWRRKFWELRTNKLFFSLCTPDDHPITGYIFGYTFKHLADMIAPILNKDGHREWYYYIGYDIRRDVWHDARFD